MIGVHGTSYTNQGNSKKCASFISSMMVHPWSVVWPVWILSPCLVACTMVNQHHPWTHWGIDRGVKTCMNGWSAWYITHHPRQRMKVTQCSSIHPWYILWMLWGQYGCDPLRGCLYNGVSTSPMYPLMYWEGCWHMYVWLKRMVHYTLSKAIARSVPLFIHSPTIHPCSIMWSVWMWSPCLVACAMMC